MNEHRARTDELMQSSQDFIDEQRANSDEMIRQARENADARFEEMKSGTYTSPSSSSYSSSSSSGRGIRIKGRTIKGILMLVALVVGGLWKLATSITGGGGGGSGEPPKINL